MAAFYKFADLPQYRSLRDALEACCADEDLRGTILLAREGINGTVSGRREGLARLFETIRACPPLADLSWTGAVHREHPFGRMKVRVKREVVTLGVAGIDPARRTGEHVAPEAWNALISDPGVTVIDTRNRYEVYLGTFKGALNPQTDSFRDFPAFVAEHLDPARDRRIAMFCTGGIRCEKASSFLLEAGFEAVYQLDGGILAYLDAVDPQDSLWRGECFVFDDRVSVDEALQASEQDLCPNCRMPIGPGERTLPEFIPHVCCVHCHDQVDERRRAALEERHRQQQLTRARASAE